MTENEAFTVNKKLLLLDGERTFHRRGGGAADGDELGLFRLVSTHFGPAAREEPMAAQPAQTARSAANLCDVSARLLRPVLGAHGRYTPRCRAAIRQRFLPRRNTGGKTCKALKTQNPRKAYLLFFR